jgi:ParB family chromosome partitioning protein
MQGELREVPVENCIVEGDFNTRSGGVGDVTDLAESIKAGGVKEPLLGKDRENSNGDVEIYAGNRRLAAAIQAGLKTVPVVVSRRRALTRKDMLVANITENVIRKNLNPVDEARGFHRLQEEHSMSISEICASLGVKKDFVQDRLALLKLQAVVLAALQDDSISIQSAVEIDRLPVEKQEKFVNIAMDLKGRKLRSLVDKELEKIQRKIEGVDTKSTPKDPDAAVVTEHVRAIRKASSLLCNGLGYEKEQAEAVKAVNYRALGPDDLGVIAKFMDDCADQVEDDIAYNDKAMAELVEAVNGDGSKVIDGPVFREGLLAVIRSRAEMKAREVSPDKPRVTLTVMREVIGEFFEVSK